MLGERTYERISTGIGGLDDILGGGLDADGLNFVEGMPGRGKTTLALQFLLEGMRRGKRALYVILSESEAELRLVATRHGWSMMGVPIFQLVPRETVHGPDQEVTLFYPAEMELGANAKGGLVVGPPLTLFRGIFRGTPNYFGESKPLMAELGDGTSS